MSYSRNGKEYVRVTSIIDKMFPFDKEFFEKWCKKEGYDPEVVMNLSKVMGSKVSNWFKAFFNGLEELAPIPVGKQEEYLKAAVYNFLDEFELLDCERTVYSEKYAYAGTFDGMVRRKSDGKVFLVDFKTYGAWNKKKTEYKRPSEKIKKAKEQVSMYLNALMEEGLTDEVALAVVVLIPLNRGYYDFVSIEKSEKWKEYIALI